jgi:hypothetical protein
MLDTLTTTTTTTTTTEQHSNKAHFEITEIDKNISLKLAVPPLTESREKYPCLYLQLPPAWWTPTNNLRAY